MPENTQVETSRSSENVFSDPHKQKIFNRTETAIREDRPIINRKYPQDDHAEFGNTFEKLGKEEVLEDQVESEEQTFIREILEEMYQEAEVYLGTGSEKPCRPDGVSVTFNERGQLVLNEILEFKTSLEALTNSIDKNDQPTKTLATMEALVYMLNRIISGENIDNISAQNSHLSQSEKQYRDFKLIGLQKQVSETLVHSDTVLISDNLTYHIVLPAGEAGIEFDDDHLIQNGHNVKIKTTYSSFSKDNVHEILKYIKNNP